jgi:uncharacterized coiled-coil DUF342 family protein
MNKERREKIEQLSLQLDDIRDEISQLSETEQECYDNLPESFQYSEKGDRMQEIIESLNSAVDSIDEAISSLDEAIEN